MKRIVFWVIAISVALAGGILLANYEREPREITAIAEQATGVHEREVPEVTTAPRTLSKPATIEIPELNLRTNVEHVAEDERGRMDVPQDWNNVAWWEPGTLPGETGSAVIAGHLDSPDGSPSVFYGLRTLNSGDEVLVTGEDGETLRFEVIDSAVYKDANFPIDLVFAANDAKRLNLITCEGTFDRVASNYSDRYVVFTELVE